MWLDPKGEDPTPRTISIDVFNQEQYDGDWPPLDAAEFLAWFQNWIEQIPPEFRSTARVEIESVSSWEDSHYAKIAISYSRPETADEIAARVKKAADARKAAEAQEMAAYAKLKAKYEA